MEISQAVEVGRATPEQVMARLARGEKMVFLDTRNPKAWAESDARLPGAIRVEATECASTCARSRTAGPSSPTAPDRTKDRAPVRRRT